MFLRAIEAGRVISRRNESVIRSAILSLTGLVEMLSKPEEEDLGSETGTKGKKKAKAKVKPEETKKAMESIRALEAAILRQSDAIGDQRQAIRAAAKMKLDPMDAGYVWTREIFPDAVVVEHEDEFGGSRLYAMSYTIDKTSGSNAVLLGEPSEVELAYMPISTQATESDRGDHAAEGEPVAIREAEAVEGVEPKIVELVEAKIAEDGSIPIKIADPGWGTSGYYSKDLLKTDGPKVFREGLHMYMNHSTATEQRERPERDVRDLAAVLTENAAWQDNGPKGPGLYARAKVMEHWRGPLESLAGNIGLSMDASGTAKIGEAEGRKGRIITSLVNASSVDFVTKAGRGGEIVSLMEAARKAAWESSRNEQDQNKEEDFMDKLTESEIQNLKEAAAKMPELLSKLSESDTTIARQSETIITMKAERIVEAALKESKLPEMAQKRLMKSLPDRVVLKEGAIDTEAFSKVINDTIADEVAYLTEATGAGRVRGFGGKTTETTEQGVTIESLTESFRSLGMSETSAKIAANGR